MDRPLRDLVELFSRLPGIGERTATRLVMHILSGPDDYARALGESVASLHSRMNRCEHCRSWTSQKVCSICSDSRRDSQTICVVCAEPDMWAIEKAGVFRGRYYLLHGLICPLDGVGPEDLEIEGLEKMVTTEGVREVILALRSSVEGEATALYLANRLGKNVKVSRLASGLPHGSEIEYADRITLARALEGRRGL